MLIREIPKHFDARQLEWFNALQLFLWGSYVIVHPFVMNTETFAGFRELTPSRANPAIFWGVQLLLFGAAQALALYLNGSRARTPVIRMVCSAFSAYLWYSVSRAFWGSPVSTTAVTMYPVLVLQNVVSMYRAACDAVISEFAHRVTKMGVSASGGSSGGGR